MLLAACGSHARPPDGLRPPASIVISASIGQDRIAVSPRRFGAGPVEVIITNQTDAAQRITVESAGRTAGFRTRTGRIEPQDTATLKADVGPGPVTLRVQGDAIRPARLTVGRRRPSAQDDLLQP